MTLRCLFRQSIQLWGILPFSYLNQQLPQHQERRFRWIVGLGAVAAIAFNLPAKALQVTVTPANPKLGDTLSVVVQYDDLTISATPQVTLGNQTFQTFLIAPNQFRALLPTTPLDKPGSLKIQVSGEGQTETVNVNLGNRKFPTQSIWLSGKGTNGTDYEFDRVDAFKKLVTPEKFWHGKFRRPNQGPITSGYGIRRYYNGVFAKDYFHRGLDYAGAHGSPVVAPAAGRVALVGRVAQGFRLHGNTVGIDHGQGVTTIYLHLSRINVKEGDFVQPGQVIGAVGSTGAATGPHLHWGLYVNGLSVDPAPWRDRGFE
ncbi:metalloendopeptidase-like membrane protein [Leptolyngbyaceae cyanobacterium JSC-12]|nr:metalloendopeptidase-like membrane protein [Leptolyngbyaceae cyanobacterium JSC-12]